MPTIGIKSKSILLPKQIARAKRASRVSLSLAMPPDRWLGGRSNIRGNLSSRSRWFSWDSPDIEGLGRQERLDHRRARALALRPFLNELYSPPRSRIADGVIVCRCEEVTAGTIRAVARSCPPDPGAVKAATRCGMGPCQGRQCCYSMQALLAEVHNLPKQDGAFSTFARRSNR